MAIYELSTEEIRPVPTTTFAEAQISERQHLQRVLREKVETVAPGAMILAEEFGEWEGSKRRIDLLALDSHANLVVIELKRDEDGAHMELQALRYAAMVSTMTFARAVDVHQRYLAKLGREGDARSPILLTSSGRSRAKRSSRRTFASCSCRRTSRPRSPLP